MKTISKNIAVFALLLSNTLFYAQTIGEHHNTLTLHHENAKTRSKAIVDGATATKDAKKKSAEEAAKNLEDAKGAHEHLKKSMPEKHKKIAKQHHEAIDRYHSEATKQVACLNDELKKPTPDETKVKEHAKNFHESISKAEKEHQTLKEKTK